MGDPNCPRSILAARRKERSQADGGCRADLFSASHQKVDSGPAERVQHQCASGIQYLSVLSEGMGAFQFSLCYLLL